MTPEEAVEKFYAALETAKAVNGHVVVTVVVGEAIKELIDSREASR